MLLFLNKLPPPSTPRATGHNPAATTAADPLEEPPAILLMSYGFLVALHKSLIDEGISSRDINEKMLNHDMKKAQRI